MEHFQASTDGALDSFLLSGDLQAALRFCEQQELTILSHLSQGAESQRCYETQMALYLINGDTDNARYLWRRLPAPHKAEGSQLALMWAIGQAMWRRDIAATYLALQQQWSPQLSPLMSTLADTLRRQQLRLIGDAYRSLPLTEVATKLGQDLAAAKDSCRVADWSVDEGSGQVTPSPLPAAATAAAAPSLVAAAAEPTGMDTSEHLRKMTQYVTYLEKRTTTQQ